MKSICFIEVDSINELGRFACALERISMPLYYITSSKILAIQTEPINERPIYYYTKSDQYDEFLAYKIIGCKEDVKMMPNMIETSYTYAPIITIKELPDELLKDDENKKCKKIVLNDLNSLAKLCSYKSMIDESPIPLLAFNNNLGMFLSLDDNTHFYCIEEEPTANFLRYSMALSKASFTNKVEEHGYIYTKIIKLRKHPLVET